MLIAQITDCHITAPWERMADRVDPSPSLAAVIDSINAFEPLPDLVVGTGDLVNDGRPAEYDQLQALLAELQAPFVPLPGNHDDRTELRRRFPQIPSGDRHDPIDHVIDLETDGVELRLVCLDTTIPGRNDGRLTDEQCQWLDDRLSEGADRPTMIFQHHPPFASGIVSMDRANGLSGVDAEAAVIARHRQVELVSCGHYHRSITRRFAGTVAACWPSTAVQLELTFADGPPQYRSDPVAWVLHRFEPRTGVSSHLMPVADAEVWVPSWATS